MKVELIFNLHFFGYINLLFLKIIYFWWSVQKNSIFKNEDKLIEIKFIW